MYAMASRPPLRTRVHTIAWVLATTLHGAGCAEPPTATAPDGIDAIAFEELGRDIAAGEFGAVRSLLVTRGDQAPAERYFRGARRSEATPVYSVTKSITSLLVGIAISDGHLGEARHLDSILAPYATQIRSDPRRARLTLRDLLTMRAGIAWNEFAAPYGTPQNPLTHMFQSADWIGHMLGLPMAAAPDSVFNYNSGVSVLLGAALAAATSRPVLDFAQDRLFDALGIARPDWHASATGVVNTGAGLSLRPADLLRIGQLVLADGQVDGQNVVSADWIHRSMQPVSSTYGGTRYGYQWWLFGPDGPYDAAHPIHAAVGYGGQFLFIDPTLRIVAVVTADAFDRDPIDLALALLPRLVSLADPGSARAYSPPGPG